MPPSVLVIISDGIEEIEALTPVDYLRRAGAKVTIASAENRLEITGRNNIRIVADVLLDESNPSLPDLLFIPGGPSHKKMMTDQRILNLLKAQDYANRWIASICAGPMVLNEVGLLTNKSFTSHYTTQENLPLRLSDEKVVCHEKLITSQGAGTANEFSLALIEALFSKNKRQEIAESISYLLPE